LEIPFFVTVHDAWWLGDQQFLIDENGNPCDPRLHDPLIAARYSNNVSNTLQRQRYLATQLKKARKLLAVSHSQAELYQKNGFMSAIASPNGIPESFRIPRQPSPDKKLRLGYAGGICTHKGYYLLKKAIEQANLQQTTLTVIDLFTSEGNPYWETWGSTPVRFIPKIPFDRMSDFYSKIDVLVCPSIWPESFGLISREATLAGVWVVASNLGALAEDIKPSVHGDIFSPQHPEELVAILQKLDRDPKTYQQPIPPEKTDHIRTLSEQIEELHQLYHEQLSQK
jgi:glycosyltransferase involved in cell wall biosynthesis